MNVKRILIAGVVLWIVDSLFGWLTCGWLFNWVYLIPPNIWKEPAEMMSTGSMIGMNLSGIARAMVFATVFAFLYKGIQGNGVKKGIKFGLIVWLLSVLSGGFISMPFFMTIATTVVVYWIIQALVSCLIDGAIVGVIYREK